MSYWVEVLKSAGVEQVQATGKSRVTFCCPFHADKHPSAHITIDTRKFRCFAATCDTTILDPVVLVQRINRSSYIEGAEYLKRTAPNTEFLRAQEVRYLQESYVKERRLEETSAVFHKYLLSVWDRTDLPESTQKVVDYLKRTREVTDPALISSLGIFPRVSDFKTLFTGTEEDLTWCLKLLGVYLDNRYVDNVVFTYGLSSTHITGFKLRNVNQASLPINSTEEEVRKHSEVWIREEGEPIGFFGITNSGYKGLMHSDNAKNIIVVEGEFDQISLYKNQAKLAVFNDVIVAASGNGHAGLDALRECGFVRASVIGDDDKGGRGFVETILQKTKDLSLRIYMWDDSLRIPHVNLDPDEAIKRYPFDKIYGLFTDDANYKYPPRWCRDAAEADLANTNPEDVKAQEEIARKWGNYIKDETELRTYCDLIIAEYPLLTSAGLFKEIRKSDDSDISFIHNMANWIQRKMMVLFMDSTTNELFLYHRIKRTTIRVSMRSKQTAYSSFFQQVQGATSIEWARDEIGLPSYYPPVDIVVAIEGESVEKPGTKFVRSQIESCLYEAFGLLVGYATPKPMQFLSQGIHLEDVDTADTPGYVVNADHVYRLIWNEAGDNLIEVTELEGPVDGKVVFDLDRRGQITTDKAGSWLQCVKEPKDFFAKPKYTLHECYNLIYEIINAIAEFKFQSNDAQYCVYLIMYTYLSDAMQRRVMTHLHGEFESGKSSILSVLAGGQQLWEYRLSYHASTLDSYSQAGLFQGYHGTKVMIGLDEANDNGDEHNNKIRKILESVRGLATKGNADRTIGTIGQRASHQALHNPMITASAQPIFDDMDYSRFRTLALVKNPNKTNTRVVLSKRFGNQLCEDLRDSIFLNVIRIAPKIATIYRELPVEFSSGTKHRLDREVDGLLPLAAIAKHLDHDYISFITQFCTNRDSDTELRKISRDGQSILDKLLNIPKVNILLPGSDGPREMSLRTAFRTEAARNAINQSECGVYYDEQEQAIGVAWEQARISLLHHDKNLRTSAKMLKGNAATSEFWINDTRAIQSGLQKRLMNRGLAGATIFSFFTVASYIKKIEDSMVEAEGIISDDKRVTTIGVNEHTSKGKMNL